MFNPSSSFDVVGQALGLEFHIQVRIEATTADASPLPAGGTSPLVVDVQNVQTLIVSALNGVFIKLQHMHTHLDGSSIHDLRVGRVSSKQVDPATEFLTNFNPPGKPQ